GGSRKDHYEAATDFWRVMQEIMERRFRWNLRQVLAAVDETARAVEPPSGGKSADRERAAFTAARLGGLRAFFTPADTGMGAFIQGKAFAPEAMQNVLTLVPGRGRDRH